MDGDLELVAPDRRYIDHMLAACRHPLTGKESPEQTKVSRQSLLDFLSNTPNGYYYGDVKRGYTPSYHFWMKLSGDAPIRIAGGIGLRIGDTPNILNYVGHIGYGVYPPARGRHLAERSCQLLFPLAIQHGMKTIWITCNPENLASRRTCERLGGTLVDIVPVPPDHELYARGEHAKCRYRIEL